MLCSLHITNISGQRLISRDYRGPPDPDALGNFTAHLSRSEDENQACPVFCRGESFFAFVRHSDLYFVAVLRGNANVSLAFAFLHKLVGMMGEYFERVEVESVRDNFVIIYELLDEILDFGYPQITEGRILKEYITQEGSRLECRRLPSAVTGAVSWRPEGLHYEKNEVFVDVTETVNVTARANGTVVRSEVLGSVVLRTRLSGMPELHLGVNERALALENGDSFDLDEVKFHQCVRLWKFERDRSVVFVPPDGEFELMSYRITSRVEIPIIVRSTVEIYPDRRIEYVVSAEMRFKCGSTARVVVEVPVPHDADTPVLSVTAGSIRYCPERAAVLWDLPVVRGGEFGKQMSAAARFGLPSVSGEDPISLGPVKVRFTIPYFQLSGIKIKYVHAIEKSGYSTTGWLHYQTQSGEYFFRQHEIWHRAPSRLRMVPERRSFP